MISYDNITSLPAYQKILDMGCEDLSTPLLKKRGNIRLANSLIGKVRGSYWRTSYGMPKEDEKATVVIYQNGYVRRFFTETPAPIKSLYSGALESRGAYADKLDRTRYYLIKKFLKDSLGVSKRTLQNSIAIQETWGDSVVEMFKLIPSLIVPWLLNEAEPVLQKIFLSSDNISEILAKEIMKAPGKWAIMLREIPKEEAVIRAITLLPPEMKKIFIKDLKLTGDLADLGL